MSIEYRIDRKRRLVIVTGRGTVTPDELGNYQRTVWSNPEVAGYNELADMREVEHVIAASPEQMSGLARLAATMDAGPPSSKFAIVAPQDAVYGLGRMFEAYRGLESQSKKQVAVFRSMEEALQWLGMEGGP